MTRKTSISIGICLFAIVCLVELVTSSVYPPRSLSTLDHCTMVLVPITALFLARPTAPWRHYLYLGIFGTMPFLSHIMFKRTHAFRSVPVHISVPPSSWAKSFAEPVVLMILLPSITIVFGIALRKILIHRQQEKTANQTSELTS